MFVLGLTGSIAMGKSTAAEMFRRLGCPVHNADQVVHRLLARGGGAVGPVSRRFGDVRQEDGGIDRQKLGAMVFADSKALGDLEAILHPLVREAEARFLKKARGRGEALAVLDIPLLFETGGEARCDGVAVVSAPAFVQRDRALSRPGMTKEKFDSIKARQMSDLEKRKRADWILPTGLGKRFTLDHIRTLLTALKVAQGWYGERI